MKIKCLIVDDEPLAIDVIASFVERIDELELVGKCENAIEAFKLLQKEQIDLLFLDIQMPMLDGLSLLKALKNPPKVIITTAFRDYAVESFELDVLDYLLKPIAFQRFMKAIGKVLQQQIAISPTIINKSEIETPLLLDNEEVIFFKVDKKTIKVAIDDILYIESLKDYIRVKTTTAELITYQTLNGITEKLPIDKFVRIHKSFTIALHKVSAIDGNEIEIGGKLLPIGRNYREEALEKIYHTGIWGAK